MSHIFKKRGSGGCQYKTLIGSLREPSSLLLRLCVNNLFITALIDTGSSLSLCTEKVARKNCVNAGNITLNLVNSVEVKSQGSVMLNCTYGLDKKILNFVLILSKIYPMVLTFY